jgi:peptide-methionine (S)-S-oxide reductase
MESIIPMKLKLVSPFFVLALSSCGQSNKENPKGEIMNIEMNDSLEVATLAGGCFWCVEAVYGNVNGVTKVESGYAGGFIKNPSYKEVCNETTGHAEAIQVYFDPHIVSFSQLLEIFFVVHDPTTLNRQGPDAGTQYRSAVFYHNEKQKELAMKAIQAINETGEWGANAVTEVTEFTNFYKAENYHQDYYALNGEQPYCRVMITPKLEKFKKRFVELAK